MRTNRKQGFPTEFSANLGEGIGNANGGRGGAVWTELIQERGKHIREPIQALHVSYLAGQMGEPFAPIAVRMIVEGFDLALFIHDTEQIERDDLFVGKTEMGIRRKALYMDPKLLVVELAHGQI